MEDLIIAIQSLGQKDCFDYIQLVATVISIIISAIAVYIAVRIPKQIAEQQNKIALFEKRFECYIVIQRITTFALKIKDSKNSEDIKARFLSIMGYNNNCFSEMSFAQMLISFQNMERVIVGGEFLFYYYNLEILQKLILDVIQFTRIFVDIEENHKIDGLTQEGIEKRDEIVGLGKEIRDEYLDLIEKELYLNEIRK